MNTKYYILKLILLTGITISCNFQDPASKRDTEEAKIFSMFIDEMAVAFPLPVMPSEKNFQKSLKETNWDSIKKVKTTLVVDTIMFNTGKKFDLPHELKPFQSLVDSINKLSSKPIKKDKIKSEEGHNLIFGNSLEDFQGGYPQMVYMSRIAFNDDNNRAAVFAGHSSGKLSGYLNLYLVEKIEGRWKIIYKKNIEVT